MSQIIPGVEDFIQSPLEQVALKAQYVAMSLEGFQQHSPYEICRSLLILDKTAKHQMAIRAYESAIAHFIRGLLMYQKHVHNIRRSKTIPIRIKSRVEENITKSVALVEWMLKKFFEQYSINALRHQKDVSRQNEEQERLFDISHHILKSFKSIHIMPMPSESRLHLRAPLRYCDSEYQRLVTAWENGDVEKHQYIPCQTGKIMRNVYLPSKTASQFHAKVYTNYFRKIKTVAILATSSQTEGVAVVSHLIIPEQKGDNNYVHMTKTEELEDYMTSNNLMQIGLAYTKVHNSVTLNWLEVHELCSLRQKVLEAFAMVLPNTLKEVEYLWITEAGFQALENCKEESVHTHNFEEAIFQEPVHLMVSDKYEIQVKDFRKTEKIMVKPGKSSGRGRCLTKK